MKARIAEIFSSIQGEGLWVGKPQTFVRFHGCKLNCEYCDTPLAQADLKKCRIEYPPFSKKFEKRSLELTKEELNEQITRFQVSSLAITGGEPLEQVDFLKEWFESLQGKYEILLETNGIETEALSQVITYVDLVSFDIKIPSVTAQKAYWEEHDQFIQVATQKPHYAKIVYDEKMTDDELERTRMFLNKHPNLTAIFQPVSPIQKRDLKKCLAIFQIFSERFPKRTRFIYQMHKILDVF